MKLALISPTPPKVHVPDFNHMKLERELKAAAVEIIPYGLSTEWVEAPDKSRLKRGDKLEDNYRFHYREVMYIHNRYKADVLLDLQRIGGLLPQHGLEFCQFMLMSGTSSLFILASREDEALIQSLAGVQRPKPPVYNGYAAYHQRKSFA